MVLIFAALASGSVAAWSGTSYRPKPFAAGYRWYLIRRRAMSLDSPISDRTGRFIRAALQQNDGTIQAHIHRQRIQIELDPKVVESLTGQLILFTLLNLLIRLDAYCPQLDVRLPVVPCHPFLRLLEPQRLLD